MRDTIKKEIVAQGYTINGFADKIGVRRSTLIDFLNKKQDTGSETFIKILHGIGWVLNTPNSGRCFSMERVVVDGVDWFVGKETSIMGKAHKVVCVLSSESETVAICYNESDGGTVVKEILK
jgi:transcriptional regulator with XRE-family HTH domain